MKSLPKRLFILFAGIGGLVVCASTLSAVVEYKPWGVPDSRRQEYDAKLAQLNQRDLLHQRFAECPRPIAVTESTQIHCGLLAPGSEHSQGLEIRNEGLETLELAIVTNESLDVSLAASKLKPNESTRVEVSWKTGEASGEFTHRLSLHTNDPLKPSIHFDIRGEIGSQLVVPDSISFKVADPANQTSASLVIYSQTWPEFQIRDISCGLDVFEWHAEPIEESDPELDGCEATSAWRVRLWTTPMKFGRYTSDAQISIVGPTGKTKDCTIQVAGRVRPPIVFHSPEIHMSDGLDLGTRVSGTEHTVHLTVRVRGDVDRTISVLDVQPPELEASLKPQSTPGNYRLTLTIPADSPMVVFNIPEKHGYVEIGDPDDGQFKNWFPIHGAVVPAQR